MRYTRPVIACACCVLWPLTADARAQTKLFTFDGDAPVDFFGYAHSGLGDIDGDGFGDFVVGIREDDAAGTNAGAIRVFSGASGRALYTVPGRAAGDQFGSSVRAAGDIDRDGIPDIVVGAPAYDYNPVIGAGFVRVLSGRTGVVLFTFAGDTDRDGFGLSVDGGGDVNGDGWPDLLVGAAQYSSPTSAGYVRVFSGRDGALLHEWRGDAQGDFLGLTVSFAGDLDGDTRTDVLVGAPGNDAAGDLAGQVKLLSGRDGRVLATLLGPRIGDMFGVSVRGGRDVDADGIADFVVGAIGDDTSGQNSGAVYVFSGQTRAVMYSFRGDRASDYFGIMVSLAGDLDADGRVDIAVGSHQDVFLEHTSFVRAFSGRDGRTLFTLFSSRTFDHFGFSVSAAGDVNRDGYDDLLVGAHTDWTNGWQSGGLRVYTARTMPLAADSHTLSVSRGGAHNLALDAGVANAGRPYLVLGTTSGSVPGVRIGPHTLPLNPDGYFDWTLVSHNVPPLLGSLGVLDAAGRANARFVLPAGSPAFLAGFGLNHAYLVANGSTVAFASNAVPLGLGR